MAERNQAAELFREMSQARVAMDFRYADDLRGLLMGMPGFVGASTEFRPSTAAANAAKGSVRFTLFADILGDIKSLGLDPRQVQQGVIFFSGNRALGS
jgi:hypothetical protein